MTFTFKLARRLAHAWAALLLLSLAQVSCSEPQLIEGFVPPSDTAVAIVKVTPALDTTIVAQAIQLHAIGMNANGDPVPVSLDWSATGGSVDGTGRFVANTPGNYWIRAQDRAEPTLSDSARILVNPAAVTLTRITLSPATVSVVAGASQPFSVSAQWSDGSSTTPAVSYTATGGTITAGGVYTAGTTAGSFRVIATQQGGTLADTSTVTVTAAPPVLQAVILTPGTASLVSGATQQFTVSGQWSNGATTVPSVTYSATGGTITGAGLYTAGSTTGSFRVIATQQGGQLADTGTVTITAAPAVLTAVILNPSTASVVAGATQQFTVSGQWSNGATTTPAVTWSATGGTITAGGTYTAGSTTGSFRVIATQQGGTLADTGAVTITAPPPVLQAVVLTPSSASLTTGGTRQFSVAGQWSNGATTAPAVNYSATGGTVTAGGLYTAGSTAGSFRVIATQQGGTLADTSAVTITAPAPVLQAVILTPASASVAVGATRQFSVSGQWSDGATTAPSVTYSATGGTITTAGLYTAGSTAGSFRVIATQQGGTLADTSAVTVTAAAPVLQAVILSPASASVTAGTTRQFSVSGQWSDGATTAPSVTYSATGGTITSGGLYSAAGTTGSFRVIATAQTGGLADTAAVTVTSSGSTGTTEPIFNSASNTTDLSDDFESYPQLSSVLRPTGPWDLIPYLNEPGPMTVETGIGYDGAPVPSAGLSGRALHIHWTRTYDGTNIQPDQGVARDVASSSRTLNFTYYYRADPGFIYGQGYPTLGKKHFLFGVGQAQRFTLSLGDNMNQVLPSNPPLHPGVQFNWSLMQSTSNPNYQDYRSPPKIDSYQDYYPFGNGTPAAFMAYLANGQWHRITIQRVAESGQGSLDGAIKVWVDGQIIINHSNIGTGTFTSGGMQFASTFNGGSQQVQQEYYDQLRVWH